MGDSSKVVTGIAEYTCKTRLRHLDTETPTRPVSAIVAEGEDPAVKLAEEARKLEKTIAGCYDVRFTKMLPPAKEAPKVEEKPKAEAGKEPLIFRLLDSYGKAMDDCRKALGSYVLCKPQP